MADPVSPALVDLVEAAARAENISATRGGTYLVMEGPQFSTMAESELYRAWGCDVIGMTAMPEAKLAREAELPYALIGMVTDYDCWKEDEPPADVAIMLARLQEYAGIARRLVVALALGLPKARAPSPIDTNLDDALLTAPEARDPAMIARLDAICRRVLG
jgi:5'-methylthioadenosine phosphorylase